MRGTFGGGNLLLVAAVALGAGGCACRRPVYGPPPAARCESPEGLFVYFRECVAAGEYTRAWWCLSRRAHASFPQQEFQAVFEAEPALRDLVTDSRIVALSIDPAGDRAEMRIENLRWGRTRRIAFVPETVGAKRLWSVDLSRAEFERLLQ